MTEPSDRAGTTITLDFADAAKARDAFGRIEVWVHEVGIANDCTLAMSIAPAKPSDAEVEAAARAITSLCDDPVRWKWNVPKVRAALVAAAKVRAGR